jgi:hypothetical protein
MTTNDTSEISKMSNDAGAMHEDVSSNSDSPKPAVKNKKSSINMDPLRPVIKGLTAAILFSLGAILVAFLFEASIRTRVPSIIHSTGDRNSSVLWDKVSGQAQTGETSVVSKGLKSETDFKSLQ